MWELWSYREFSLFIGEVRLSVNTRLLWALVNATSRRSLRLLCGEYGQIKWKMCMPFGAETMEIDLCTVETAVVLWLVLRLLTIRALALDFNLDY